MINKIRPECKIISAPALREYSRNYNNLIEKLKLWKKQGVKLFCFIINVRLDRSGGNNGILNGEWEPLVLCLYHLETGDGLCTDSIRREVLHDFGDTFSNSFQAICKVYEKTMTLLNPCKLLMKFNQQKARTNVHIFEQKTLLIIETT